MNSEDRIVKEFEKGIYVSDSVFSYALNLGYEIGFYDLIDIIQDLNHELYDDLIMLLFAPDFNLRKRFANIWADIVMEDQKPDLEMIYSSIKEIYIISDFEQSAQINVDKKKLLYFFEKLDFLKNMNKEILSLVSEQNKENHDLIFALIWENADKIKEEKTGVLKDYFKKSDILYPFFEDEFRVFLNILSSWNYENKNFEKYLANLFQVYTKAAEDAAATDNFIKNNNVETFLVQGGRIPAADPVKLSVKKNQIRDIALKLGFSKELFVEDSFDSFF